MPAQAAKDSGDIVVIGEHRTAVAVAAKRLGWKKAGRRCIAQGADGAAAIGGTKTLRGVGQHTQIVAARQFGDRFIVGRLPEQVDRNYRPRGKAVRWRRFDRAFEAMPVDIERVFIDVDHNRGSAGKGNHFGGCNEGKGRHEYSVARSDLPRHQSQQQRIGAAGGSDAVACTTKLGKRRFQFADFRAQDEPAMIEDRTNGGVDIGANAIALRRQIDKRNCRRHGLHSSNVSFDVST